MVAGRNQGIQLEGWAHRVADLVEGGLDVEDSRVELKADWPDDTAKAARQLAGHLNASQSPEVLWLIGVDEKKGVVGCSTRELSTWWRSVTSRFDETPPTLILDRQIVHGDRPVTALLISTDRAPFVVKNPAGGQIDREVPWREGRSTRSARRSDLVRLLEPMIKLPEIEVRTAVVSIDNAYGNDRQLLPNSVSLSAHMEFYLEPYPGDVLAFPDHRTRIDLQWGRAGVEHEKGQVHLYASGPGYIGPGGSTYDPPHSIAGHKQITIHGPGLYSVREYWQVDRWRWAPNATVHMRVTMQASRSSSALTAYASLAPRKMTTSRRPHERQVLREWRFVAS